MDKIKPFFKFFFSKKNVYNLNPLLISRISIGVFFLITGINKLFTPVFQLAMLDTITNAGFPYPTFTAHFAASGEALLGLLLALGLLTRFSAAGLMVILAAAMFTVDIPLHIPKGLDIFTWYSYFLYLPQTLYMLILLNILMVGPGPLSIDSAIHRKEVNQAIGL